MKRAVVLLSGGLDSAVTAALARQEVDEVHALNVSYGQTHAAETLAARRLCREHGFNLVASSVSLPLRSALTGHGLIPVDRTEDEIGEGIPSTYVPCRNTIFLAMAAGLAESVGASSIWIGATSVDFSGYPDCRPDYFAAFEAMLHIATAGPLLEVVTPLIDKSKAEIVRLGLDLGVRLDLTSSCYQPSPRGEPCQACDACVLRAKGFAEVGVNDPLVARFAS